MRRSVWGNRDFALLAVAVALSAGGDFVALIALISYVHDHSGSGFAISALAAANFGAIVLASPHAGVIVDRVETRRVLFGVSLASAAICVGLSLTHALGPLLVLFGLLGAATAVSQPAEFALIAACVEEEQVPAANAHVETMRYVGLALGPVLGGVLVKAGGMSTALLVDAATFLAITGAAAVLRVRRPPAPVTDGVAPLRARDGFGLLLGHPILRPAMLGLTVALVAMSSTIPADVFFFVDSLDAGTSGFGLAYGLWTAGMFVGALILARHVQPAVVATVALAALAVQGAGKGIGAAVMMLGVAYAGYAIGGVAHGLKNVLARTLIHTHVPANAHGRAFAAYGALRNGAELGALALGGALVAWVGARTTIVLAGSGTVLAGLLALGAVRAREQRRAPDGLAGEA